MEKIKLSAEYSIEELEAIIAGAKKKSDWRSKLVQKGNDYLIVSHQEDKGFSKSIVLGPLTVRNPIHAFHPNQKDFAQLIADKCTLMLEMHQFAYYNNDGWVADWNDENEKYGIVFPNGEELFIDNWCNDNRFIFGISVKSKELTEQMLVEFGDRIKALYNIQTA